MPILTIREHFPLAPPTRRSPPRHFSCFPPPSSMLRYDGSAPAYTDWTEYAGYSDSCREVYPATESVYAMVQDFPSTAYQTNFYTCTNAAWTQPMYADSDAYDASRSWWTTFEQCASPGSLPSLSGSRSNTHGSRTPSTPRSPEPPRSKLEPVPASPPPQVKYEPVDGFVLDPATLLAESSGRDTCVPPTQVPLRATQAPPAMRRMMGVFRLDPFARLTEAEVEAGPLDKPGEIITFQLDGFPTPLDDPSLLAMPQENSCCQASSSGTSCDDQRTPHRRAAAGRRERTARDILRSQSSLSCGAQPATPTPSSSLRTKAARSCINDRSLRHESTAHRVESAHRDRIESTRRRIEPPHPYRRPPATPRLSCPAAVTICPIASPPRPAAVPPRPRRAPPVDRDAPEPLCEMNAGYASPPAASAGTSLAAVSRDLAASHNSAAALSQNILHYSQSISPMFAPAPIIAPVPRRRGWPAQKPPPYNLYGL